MPYRETIHDLHVKYSNTFVGVKLPNKTIIPAFIYSIGLNEEHEDSCEYESDDHESIPADLAWFRLGSYPHKNSWDTVLEIGAEIDELELSFPELGVLEIGPRAVYFSRLADVEGNYKYRKTPSKYSIAYKDPAKSEALAASIFTEEPYAEALFRAWNGPEYRTLEDALEELANGKRIGCALSNDYSIHLSYEREEFQVAREGRVIGHYSLDSGDIKLISEDLKRYREELEELGFKVDDEITEMPDSKPYDAAYWQELKAAMAHNPPTTMNTVTHWVETPDGQPPAPQLDFEAFLDELEAEGDTDEPEIY